MRTVLDLAPGGIVRLCDTADRLHAAMLQRCEDVEHRPDHLIREDAERLYGLRDGNPRSDEP